MKAMETIDDLIEEAKVRTVWWALCIISLTYFLTHTDTSNSMLMNLPMAVLILCGLRILLNKVEFKWKVMPGPRQNHLNSPRRKQLSSLDDARPSSTPRWEKKIDSPVVEAAINDFMDKILNDFVKSWYSSITTDDDFPELIRGVIMNALGEISVRVKKINIVDLIRDIVELIGDHLVSFRKNQAAIGTDVMKTLSSEGRDEKLKCHLMTSGELCPALMSPESEHKVLQNIVAGILSLVLRPEESQCPLVETIARELLTCLVVEPLVGFASAERINEEIEQLSINLEKVNEQKTPSKDYEIHPTDMPPEWMPPNAIELIWDQLDKVFQLNSKGGWLGKQGFSLLKNTVVLVIEDPVDDWLLRKISWLRNENTVAHGIRGLQDKLWPNGVFFTGVDDGGMKVVVKSSSYERQFEDAEISIKELLFNEVPTAFVKFLWGNLYRTCARDIFYFIRSNVCIKQLTFAILELLVLEVFPELQDEVS